MRAVIQSHRQLVTVNRRIGNSANSQVITAIVVVSMFGLLSARTTLGQEGQSDPPAAAQVEKPAIENPQSAPGSEIPMPAKVDTEKMKKAMVLLAAISAIAISGIGVIALTMLWARHLKRLARDPGPPQKTAGNDFWFLKPPKPTVSESDGLVGHRPNHSPPEQESSE